MPLRQIVPYAAYLLLVLPTSGMLIIGSKVEGIILLFPFFGLGLMLAVLNHQYPNKYLSFYPRILELFLLFIPAAWYVAHVLYYIFPFYPENTREHSLDMRDFGGILAAYFLCRMWYWYSRYRPLPYLHIIVTTGLLLMCIIGFTIACYYEIRYGTELY